LQRLQQTIDQLRADRQMLDFIKQRNASTDHSSHLGVIACVHKDFRELSAFLGRVVKQERQPDLPLSIASFCMSMICKRPASPSGWVGEGVRR